MSRIGKKPIEIPENVEVKIEDKSVTIKGPKGSLCQEIRSELLIEVKDNKIFVLPRQETKQTNAFCGTTRAILANLVEGVTRGFERKLELEGIGYRASLEGQNLVLTVGFTHPIKIEAPENVKFLVEKNVITISGIDKGKVSQLAAKIRKVRPPEVYKGKGIRYAGELVKRKEGKKAVAASR